MTSEDFRRHALNFLQKGMRIDGRKLDEYRKIVVEQDISNSAEGSAKVKIGDTEVMVGVKMELGTPYPDAPDEGTIMVGAELLPMSSPEFEPGPPGIGAIELARVVDRGIRESKTIDMKKLCLTPGEKIWIACIDIVSVNDSGNLFDASSLAAMAALKNTRMPAVKDGKIDYHEKTEKPLPLSKEPVEVTVHKIGDYFIVDPTEEEEKIIDARLTVASTADGELCALQKGGDYPLTIEDIEKMVDIAVRKGKELRKHLGGL